jgi:hypothetical protein
MNDKELLNWLLELMEVKNFDIAQYEEAYELKLEKVRESMRATMEFHRGLADSEEQLLEKLEFIRMASKK